MFGPKRLGNAILFVKPSSKVNQFAAFRTERSVLAFEPGAFLFARGATNWPIELHTEGTSQTLNLFTPDYTFPFFGEVFHERRFGGYERQASMLIKPAYKDDTIPANHQDSVQHIFMRRMRMSGLAYSPVGITG
jgi:hypothetical protein